MILTAIDFFVPGRPIPQGSKRHVGHGIMIESAKDLTPWRERVSFMALDSRRSAGLDITHGPVALRIEFILPRPKSAPKTYTPPAICRPDIDKCARAILDAITNVLIIDDAQIIELHATKRRAEIGETPGAHIALITGRPQPGQYE